MFENIGPDEFDITYVSNVERFGMAEQNLPDPEISSLDHSDLITFWNGHFVNGHEHLY